MSTCKALLSKITNKNAFLRAGGCDAEYFLRSVWWESAFYSIRL